MSREQLTPISKERFKTILKEKGITQVKLANDLIIDKDYLNKSLRREKMSGSMLLRISRYLGVSIEYLDGTLTDEMIRKKIEAHEKSELPLDDYSELTSYNFYLSKEKQKDIERILISLFILSGFTEKDYLNAKELFDYGALERKFFHVQTGKEVPLFCFEDQLTLRLFETIVEFFSEIGYRISDPLIYSRKVGQ